MLRAQLSIKPTISIPKFHLWLAARLATTKTINLAAWQQDYSKDITKYITLFQQKHSYTKACIKMNCPLMLNFSPVFFLFES